MHRIGLVAVGILAVIVLCTIYIGSTSSRMRAREFEIPMPHAVTSASQRTSGPSVTVIPHMPTDEQLIGMWQDQRSLTGEVRTLEFRSDGTFREASNGKTETGDAKVNMNSGAAYPVIATSSGTWVIVRAIDSEVVSDGSSRPPQTLRHYLGFVHVPDNATFLKEDWGVGYPVYVAVSFRLIDQRDQLDVTEIYPVESVAHYERTTSSNTSPQ